MSIQAKFIFLMLSLGAAVAVSIGAAIWALSIFHAAATLEFGSRSVVVAGLLEIESTLPLQRRALASFRGQTLEQRDPQAVSKVRVLAAEMVDKVHALQRLPASRREVGNSTSDNLHQRIDQYIAHLETWAGGMQNVDDLINELFNIEKLIEHVNHRILDGASADIAHAEELRRRIFGAMMLAIGLTSLVCVLGVLLIRRWVSRPVAALRRATATIAAGDFSHRVALDGRDEIAQLGRDVNSMAGTLAIMQEERIEQERLAAVGEMVRRLTHNLRNPMAGIRGLAELSRADASPGTDLHEQQDRIIRTVDRFEGWLSDLLSVTRPLAVDPSPHDVRVWLPPVVETLRPRAEHRGLRLEVVLPESPLQAFLDPRHLEQAVVAVVSNAIEASPPGGTIRIWAEQDTDVWFLGVTDEGPGIPLHLRDQVFKPYFTTKADGNGIGLAVVQQVVRAHGGRVRVQSGVGVKVGSDIPMSGVTMVFTLPLKTSESGDTGFGTGGGSA